MAESAAVLDGQVETEPSAEEEAFAAALAQVVHRLEAKAKKRVGQRSMLEERWIKDLQAFHGQYDEQTAKELQERGRSQSFVGMTRARTNALEARLFDMACPADDKAWAISPTPMPDLTMAAEQALERERKAREAVKASAAAQEGGDPAAQEQLSEAESENEALNAQLDEARRRAEAMEREIADQLAECRYEVEVRKVIGDAVKLGAGIMRGPVTGMRLRRQWEVREENGVTVHVGVEAADQVPAYTRIDPWAFFPDPDASDLNDGDGVLVRHLMNGKQLRRLAKLDGFDRGNIRDILGQKPDSGLPNNISLLRNISGDTTDISEFYEVWEYEGPLDVDDMRTLATFMNDTATLEDLEGVDPLDELMAVVWFCRGKPLKFSIHPLDFPEVRFSMFRLEAEEFGPWGYGIPAITRDVQSMLNGAVRACLDNAAIASGPQVLVSDGVEPEDGTFQLRPWKVWRLVRSIGTINDRTAPLTLLQPDMNLNQLLPLVDLAVRFFDLVTGIRDIDMAEPGSLPKQTATGTALLMSSVNVVFRRFVRNLDDELTRPDIRRLYYWNMQHSEKEHIKGDYEVRARGSSVLMMRELQSQNLITLLGVFGNEDPDIKADEMKREIFRALGTDPEQFLRTPEEREEFLAEQMERMAGDPAAAAKMEEVQVKREEIDANVAIAQLTNARMVQVAQINRETAMMKLAEELNMNMDELQTKLQIARADTEAKERMLATEVAVQAQQAKNPQTIAGSGGGGNV